MIDAKPSTAAIPYAVDGPVEYRKPPSTGPTIDDPVNVAVHERDHLRELVL